MDTEVAQAVHLIQDTCYCQKVCCVPAQSQEHGGESGRKVVTLEELDRDREDP